MMGRWRERIIDRFLGKLEDWAIVRAAGSVPTSCSDELKLLGYSGSERTVHRVLAEVKAEYRKRRRRECRP